MTNKHEAHRVHGAKGKLSVDVSGLGCGVDIWNKKIPIVQANLQHLIRLDIRDVDQILQPQDQRLLMVRSLLHDAYVCLRRIKGA